MKKMKEILNIVAMSLILFCVQFKINGQQSEMAWFKTISSNDFASTPGFVIDTVGKAYLPILFFDEIYLETDGGIDTIKSWGGGNAVIAKVTAETGDITDYISLASKEHLVITDLGLIDNTIVTTGVMLDSVFARNKSTTTYQYIGGQQGKQVGFIFKLTSSLEIIDFIALEPEWIVSGIDFMRINENRILASGTYVKDTTSGLENFLFMNWQDIQFKINAGDHANIVINSLDYFNEKIIVSGYFSDSIFASDTIIYNSSGNDAFMAVVDTLQENPFNSAKIWQGLQNSVAADLAVFQNYLYVAINFSDTLYIGPGITVTGRGGNDALLLKYDSLLNIESVYQIGGSYSDRIDRLFVTGDKLYILCNIGSNDCEIILNNLSVLDIENYNNWYLHALLCLNDTSGVQKIWTAKEGSLGKIVGVNKLNGSETIISGLFNQPVVIDSVQFNNAGIQDIYLLRIDDECLNHLKNSEAIYYFCEGDSVYVRGAAIDSSGDIIINQQPDSGFYIKSPRKYNVRDKKHCDCEPSYSISFEWINISGQDSSMKESDLRIDQVIYLSEESSFRIVYQGSCNNSFNNRFEHIELQPNPTNGNTTLIIIAPGYGEIEVKILNLQGSLIENLNYNLNEGSNRINLLTENFQRGTYIIRIKLTGNNLNMQRNFKLFKV
jgi:hypothetical protein